MSGMKVGQHARIVGRACRHLDHGDVGPVLEDLCRHTERKCAGRDDDVVGYHCIGSHRGAAADDGPMENDAPRSGQRLIFESAALQMGQVSDDAAVADDGGESRTGMHDGAVLDGSSRAHGDGSVVAPEDGAGPHARFGADRDIPDDDGVGVHKGVRVDVRRHAFDFVHGHGPGRYTWPAIQVTP